jgi:ankyrin repeat protein
MEAAARRGDLAALETYLSADNKYANPSNPLFGWEKEWIFDRKVTRALLAAIRNDWDLVVQRLCAEKPPSFLHSHLFIDKRYFTPLWFAAVCGSDRTVNLFLNKPYTFAPNNCAPNPADVSNALYAACERGHANVVKQLVNTKVSLQGVQSRDYLTPLHYALLPSPASYCVAKLLVQQKASIHAATRAGATPLHFAVQKRGVGRTERKLVKQFTKLQLRQRHSKKTAKRHDNKQTFPKSPCVTS